MTVSELIKALKGFPKGATVYVVNDWDIVNEEGELTEISEVEDLHSQVVGISDGEDKRNEQQVLIEI